MPESTFWSDIDRLTTANHKIVHRDKGTEVLTSSGLIQQLRGAVAEGREGGGASSAFGSRPPIDASAQDLMLEITGQAREAHEAALGRASGLKAVESHIRLWAAAVNETTVVTVTARRQYPDEKVDEWRKQGSDRPAVYSEILQLEAWRLVKHWIGRVEGFFYPPDTLEIQAPCPSCEDRFIYRQTDGQTVQSAAMVFVREEGEIVHAKCLSCSLTWGKDKFEWLATAAGATEVPDVQKGQVWVRLTDGTKVRVLQVTERLMDANVRARNLVTGRAFTILATRLADRFKLDTPGMPSL